MEKILNINYLRCLKSLLHRLPLAILFALTVGIITAITCYYVLPPYDEYTARASAYTHSTNEFGNAAEGVQYAELVKSLTVAERAVENLPYTFLDKYDVYDMIEVSFDNESTYVNSSAVIDIYATSIDSQIAVEVANAVTEAFVTEVLLIAGEDTQISMLDDAAIATVSYEASKQFWIYTGIAAAAALVLVCFVVVLLEILSFKLNSIEDGTLYGKLNIIGVIPDNGDVN